MNGSATEKRASASVQTEILAWRAKHHSRREVLAGSVAIGAMIVLRGAGAWAADGKKTFTILHTNDLHSNLIGMAPATDYTPFTLNDDKTRGGFARLATLIAKQKLARADLGPVLVLDAGDYSMGTAFAAAIRETGCELQLLSRVGCDATTFGNHDFDLGPDGTAQAIAVAAKAGRRPAGGRIEYQFYWQRPHAGRPAATGQRWRGPPLPRHRTRRYALWHLRLAWQGSPVLYRWRRRCKIRRSHRDRARDGEHPPRDGEGRRRHRAQPRRDGKGQGRTVHGRVPSALSQTAGTPNRR